MNIIKEGSIKEIKASKFSIQRNGYFAIFCGSYDIALINLNDYNSRIFESIGKKSKEICACQCSKGDNNIAIGLKNVCKIYDSDMNKVHSLKGHKMPISSIDWHPEMKHQIISSSNDNTKSFCIWDIRKPDALISWKDTYFMQQVKWHQSNTYLFATSSESDILLWDQRNMTSSINSTSGYSSYISDFDWLPRDNYSLVTCGRYDPQIKLWNFSDSGEPLKFEMDIPVSMSHCKVNYAGDKLITITDPSHGLDNQLTLWDISQGCEIIKLASSASSDNICLDFDWMNPSGDRDRIVTLHQNYDYKVWHVDNAIAPIRKVVKEALLKRTSISNEHISLSQSPLLRGDIQSPITAVSSETFAQTKENLALEYLKPQYSDSNLAIKSRMARLKTNDVDGRIQKEFDRLTNNMQIVYEKTPEERKAIAHLSLINARCSILFSYNGTTNDELSLDVSVMPEKSDKLRKQNIDELEKILKNAAGKNPFGISRCVEVAMDYINKLSTRVPIRSVRSIKEGSTSANYCNVLNVKVPFPRTCGATFSPSGHLVCFILPTGYQKKFTTTPRSFVDIVKHSNSTVPGNDFFYGYNVMTPKMTLSRGPKGSSKKNKAMEGAVDMDYASRMHSLANLQKHNFNVYIYNAQRLSLFSVDYAKKYCIDVSNIERLCEQNAEVVKDSNRKDLCEFWQYCIILARATRPSLNDFSNRIKPWPSQMLGGQMCTLWLDHFLRLMDIQSAAMLVLVMMAVDARFDEDFEAKNMSSMRRNLSSEVNQETLCADNAMNIYEMPFYNQHAGDARNYFVGHNRFYSNSYSELDHQCQAVKRPDSYAEMICRHRESCRLINPSQLSQYGLIIIHYARMLSAQIMLTAATMITRKVLPSTFFSNMSIQDQFSVRLIQGNSTSHKVVDEAGGQLLCPSEYSPRHPGQSASSSSLPRHQDPGPRTEAVLCSICRLSVHGLLSLCSQCHHGGHVNHVTAWFARHNSAGLCPTGCGCRCSLVADSGPDMIVAGLCV